MFVFFGIEYDHVKVPVLMVFRITRKMLVVIQKYGVCIARIAGELELLYSLCFVPILQVHKYVCPCLPPLKSWSSTSNNAGKLDVLLGFGTWC